MVLAATADAVHMNTWTQARQIADQTPAGRDRYIDFLRVAAISLVVIGHWLMAVVWFEGGEVQISHLLAEAEWTHYLTWILQPMPIFFIVGGFANAISWAAATAKGHSYSTWLQGRTARLLRPTMVFAGIWAIVAFVLVGLGIDPQLLRMGTQVVAVPLWFLAVYVGVVAIAPVMIGLDRRFGWLVPAGLLAAAGLVDWMHHALAVPVVGWTNFLFVWLGVHQLGVRWQQKALPVGTRGAIALGTGGLFGLVSLTVFGPYPVSMVGVPGAEWTNNLPPTVGLMALAVFQLGMILTLREPVARWLKRRSVWAAVILGNARIMTTYLWHMTAMVGVLGLSIWSGGFGFGIEPVGATWWWSRLVWIALLIVPLIALIAVFGQFEQNRSSRQVSALPVVLGVLAVMWGFATLAIGGFVTAGPASVAVMPAISVVAGSWLLGVRPGSAPR